MHTMITRMINLKNNNEVKEWQSTNARSKVATSNDYGFSLWRYFSHELLIRDIIYYSDKSRRGWRLIRRRNRWLWGNLWHRRWSRTRRADSEDVQRVKVRPKGETQ